MSAGLQDGWDKQLRYERHEANDGYLIRSAGSDGKFDTFDDTTSDDYVFAHDVDSMQKSIDPENKKTDTPVKTPGNKRKTIGGEKEKTSSRSGRNP